MRPVDQSLHASLPAKSCFNMQTAPKSSLEKPSNGSLQEARSSTPPCAFWWAIPYVFVRPIDKPQNKTRKRLVVVHPPKFVRPIDKTHKNKTNKHAKQRLSCISSRRWLFQRGSLTGTPCKMPSPKPGGGSHWVCRFQTPFGWDFKRNLKGANNLKGQFGELALPTF